MLKVGIGQLKPAGKRLNGGVTGEAHFEQMRRLVEGHCTPKVEVVLLDFSGVEGASASYLKRLLNPFFSAVDDLAGLHWDLYPVAINVDSPDLREDLEAYLVAHERVLVVGRLVKGIVVFDGLLGRLAGAAAETFKELRERGRATAEELYKVNPAGMRNQTAWNNRLAQLVELRIARRVRDGRIWTYEPTLTD